MTIQQDEKRRFQNLITKYMEEDESLADLLISISRDKRDDHYYQDKLIERLFLDNNALVDVLSHATSLYPYLREFFDFYIREENFPFMWKTYFPIIAEFLLAKSNLNPVTRRYIKDKLENITF